MFGLRRDDNDSTTSERELVPHPLEPASERSDLERSDSGISYSDVSDFVRKRRCILALIATGVLFLTAAATILICETVSSSTVVIDSTTPVPNTTTSTSTTTRPTSTTSVPTTKIPTSTTTTTNPSTTTIFTTTSIPTTPTTSYTTTEFPTSPDSMTPTTDISTTEFTTASSSTTSNPSNVPTIRPIPPHPEDVPPKSLLLQVGLRVNYTEVKCADLHPPAWRSILNIANVTKTYTGESDRKKHAETAAAMLAATDLLGVIYNYTMPPAPNPCFQPTTKFLREP